MAAVAEVDVDPGKDESSRCLGTVDLGAVDLRAPRARGRRPSRSLGEMPRPTRPTPLAPDPPTSHRVAGRRRRHRRAPGTARVEKQNSQVVLLLFVASGRPRHCVGDAWIHANGRGALLGRSCWRATSVGSKFDRRVAIARRDTEGGGSVPRLAGSKGRDGAEPAQHAEGGREHARDDRRASP